jgi:hypothetical protein
MENVARGSNLGFCDALRRFVRAGIGGYCR